MARAPRAKVSMTTGQGVSRKAYQTARAISGDARVGVKSEFSSGDSNRKDYAKKASKSEYPEGFNVSYARTLPLNDIDDLKALGKRKPPKSGVKDVKKDHKYKGS